MAPDGRKGLGHECTTGEEGGRESAPTLSSLLSLSLSPGILAHSPPHSLAHSARLSRKEERESRMRRTRRQPPLSGAAEVAGERQPWHAPRGAADAAGTREQGSCPVAFVCRHCCRRRRHFAKLAPATAVAAHEGYRARTLHPRSGVSGGADGEQRSASQSVALFAFYERSCPLAADAAVSHHPREVSRIDWSSRCQWCRVECSPPARGPDHVWSRTRKVMHNS